MPDGRGESLSRPVCPLIREDVILALVENKDVLDIGSVGQSGEYDLWGKIRRTARSAVGIDTEPSEDEHIVRGNMETYSFARQFDVVVMGDVIEHSDNQGLLLDNARGHLKDDGVLIITTPNAKWFTIALKPNPTHTLWHDRYTLSRILDRHGFRVREFRYYFGNKPRYSLLKKLLSLRQAMLVICEKKT